MYGPSPHLGFSSNLTITIIALFIAGVASSYTLIPSLPEILVETELCLPGEMTDHWRDRMNDLASGMFNTFFALGNIFGPLLGNYSYVTIGFELTCEIIGLCLLIFAGIYFVVCDDMFFKVKERDSR
jgi:MFS family permease